MIFKENEDPEGDILIITNKRSEIFYSSNVHMDKFSKLENQFSLRGFFLIIKADKDARKIFILLIINFIFTFVEFFYGIWGNSLSLISDSAHMLFDSTALAIGLYATFMSKLKPDVFYTYGYYSYENNFFLLFPLRSQIRANPKNYLKFLLMIL